METCDTKRDVSDAATGDHPERELTPAARRALDEAATRRAAHDAVAREPAPERGGRGGPEPVRFGDWEIKGRAIDF